MLGHIIDGAPTLKVAATASPQKYLG